MVADKKTIIFPATARPHLARQKLLFEELGKLTDLKIFEIKSFEIKSGENFIEWVHNAAIEFGKELDDNKYDAVIIRADRLEMLYLAAEAAYREIPIFHIEGGDLSGAIDGKVRHSITMFADYHFPTNDDSRMRLIRTGVPSDRVWNFGSLDVELVMKTEYVNDDPTRRVKDGDYMVVLFHPIEGEDEAELTEAIEETDIPKVFIGSNTDYGRKFGTEEFSPEDYINLLRHARALVGNSSSFIKEASVMGTPVVLVGDRQKGRLCPQNVLRVPCERGKIIEGINSQVGRAYEPDFTYYKENTSRAISEKITEVLD